MQAASSQQMDVQVRDRFARVAPIVDDQAIPGLREAATPRDLAGRTEHFPDEKRVLGRIGLRYAWYAAARNDEHVHWRLWSRVAKGDEIVLFEDDIRGDLAGSDLFKNGHQVREKEMSCLAKAMPICSRVKETISA